MHDTRSAPRQLAPIPVEIVASAYNDLARQHNQRGRWDDLPDNSRRACLLIAAMVSFAWQVLDPYDCDHSTGPATSSTRCADLDPDDLEIAAAAMDAAAQFGYTTAHWSGPGLVVTDDPIEDLSVAEAQWVELTRALIDATSAVAA